MMFLSQRYLGLGLAIVAGLCLGFGGIVRGQSVTMDFPVSASVALAEVISEVPSEFLGQGKSKIVMPLLPVGEEEALFVTVVFLEEQNEVLSAGWVGTSGEATTEISANLCEGIMSWNQRTFRIPDVLAHEGGALILESNTASRMVRRVAVSRVQASRVFDAADPSSSRFLSGDGRVFDDVSLSGGPPLVPPDAWVDGVLEAYLQESIEKADGNIQFVVPLEKTPEVAILRLEVSGLSGLKAPVLWVNGVNVGVLAIEVPDLRDPGYLRAPFGGLQYAGWRKGSVEINAKLLRAGDNEILLESPHRGLFVKNTVLQMQFRTDGQKLSPTLPDSDVVPDFLPETVPVSAIPSAEESTGQMILPPAPDEAESPEPVVVTTQP